MRLMELADRHGFPLVSLVDTPGRVSGRRRRAAWPGRRDRARRRRDARSAGADGGVRDRRRRLGRRDRASRVADRVLMQENAIYSVISPEGCAAILWRDAERGAQGGSCVQARRRALPRARGRRPDRPRARGRRADRPRRGRPAARRGAARGAGGARGVPGDELRAPASRAVPARSGSSRPPHPRRGSQLPRTVHSVHRVIPGAMTPIWGSFRAESTGNRQAEAVARRPA